MNRNQLLQTYKIDLNQYSPEQLRCIPAPGVWSIGQMYDHLILVAHEYLDNMEECAESLKEQPLGKTPFGEQLFREGGFPAIKIRLPDDMNSPPNNSDSREDLAARMDEVIRRVESWEPEVDAVNPNLKAEHGGFGWLNAKEWHELVGMHFRHHLRQKAELERHLT